jgi:hypothetical protein
MPVQSIDRTDTAGASPLARRQPRAAASAGEQAFLRAATESDYPAWLEHIRPAAGCTRPILLTGHIAYIDPGTGQLLDQRATVDMPDGVIYKPCGNRRPTVCPSCAETYRRDAYQLVRTGLVGGRTIPATVATNPAMLVTLTAPGFGPVHAHRTARSGRNLACRPRRSPGPCPHGVDLSCRRRHRNTDGCLGQPLCLDCYDHAAQVVWNRHAAELWRRTTIAITRHITRSAHRHGVDPTRLRISYGKVAEMQRRGVVHFHAVIRLDGRDPDHPDDVLPTPTDLDIHALTDAITHAATITRFTTDPHPTNPAGWSIAWGSQTDIRPITSGIDGDITDGKVAGYLAKYATKATETTGHTSARINNDTVDIYAHPAGSHVERLVDACWSLGNHPDWQGLRRWAHMLGFGGHFLTKSRRYSITFRLLRDERAIWQRTHTHADPDERDTTILVGYLTYISAGWHTTGDALLAGTAAATARERRQAARDELTQHHDAYASNHHTRKAA